MENHKNMGELVADIRNKLGSPYNFISLINERNKYGQSEGVIKTIESMLKKEENNVIKNMKKLIELLDQFNNYDIDNIKPTTNK